jgi:hypothetical protein
LPTSFLATLLNSFRQRGANPENSFRYFADVTPIISFRSFRRNAHTWIAIAGANFDGNAPQIFPTILAHQLRTTNRPNGGTRTSKKTGASGPLGRSHAASKTGFVRTDPAFAAQNRSHRSNRPACDGAKRVGDM